MRCRCIFLLVIKFSVSLDANFFLFSLVTLIEDPQQQQQKKRLKLRINDHESIRRVKSKTIPLFDTQVYKET